MQDAARHLHRHTRTAGVLQRHAPLMPINILFNTVVMPISSSPALANMSRPDGGLAGWLTVILILPCRHVRPASASASGRPRGGGANRSRQAGGQADSYLHRARRRQFLLRVYGALVHRVVRLFGGLVNSTVTVAELTTAWLEHSFADHSTSSALSAACRASTGWTGGVGRLLTFWGDRQVGARHNHNRWNCGGASRHVLAGIFLPHNR